VPPSNQFLNSHFYTVVQYGTFSRRFYVFLREHATIAKRVRQQHTRLGTKFR
jgi:hypothetical protein